MNGLLPSSSIQMPLMQAPTLQGESGWSAGDYVMLGNDILMQWYSATRDREPVPLIPTDPRLVSSTQVQQMTTLFIIGAVVVAAIIFSRK